MHLPYLPWSRRGLHAGQQKKIVHAASKIVRFLLRESSGAIIYEVLIGLVVGAV